MRKLIGLTDPSELMSEIAIWRNRDGFPKIIHQIWYVIPGRDPNPPKKWEQSPRAWEKHCPDFVYILWNNELGRNFISAYEPHLLERYDTFKHEIQRIDTIRFAFLKHIGGIYCDMDEYPLTDPLAYLRNEAPAYLVRSPHFPNTFQISLMFSNPAHPTDLWDLCIDEIKKPSKWWARSKSINVLTTTGLSLTRAASRCTSGYSVLPVMFDSQNPGFKIIGNLQGGSWYGLDSKLIIITKQYRNYVAIMLVIIIIAIVIGEAFILRSLYRCKKHCPG